MGTETAVTEDVLIAELTNRELHFLVGNAEAAHVDALSTAALIAGLADAEAARLHMALIALFLYQPETAAAVPAAMGRLSPGVQLRLKLFYTAAMLLQRIHQDRLRRHLPQSRPLPDMFAGVLQVDTAAAPQAQLRQLAQRHRELSGVTANWLGSYQYAAERLLTRLAREKSWAA